MKLLALLNFYHYFGANEQQTSITWTIEDLHDIIFICSIGFRHLDRFRLGVNFYGNLTSERLDAVMLDI